ncbi:MAG: hypothetical protein ABI555_02560, partial [Chloroflexota bacterium]
RRSSLDSIHHFIAIATVVVVAGGVGWSILLAASRRPGGPRFEQFQAAVVSLVFVGAASGMVLLLSGARPTEGLHLLYAVIAITLIPLARSFLGRAGGRAAASLLLAAFIALGAVLFRLFSTG